VKVRASHLLWGVRADAGVNRPNDASVRADAGVNRPEELSVGADTGVICSVWLRVAGAVTPARRFFC
jgi:hypothetical protein